MIVNIPPPEIGAPKVQSGDFYKSRHNDFDLILVVYVDALPKRKCIGIIFRKLALRTVAAEMQNIDSVDISCIYQVDFTKLVY